MYVTISSQHFWQLKKIFIYLVLKLYRWWPKCSFSLERLGSVWCHMNNSRRYFAYSWTYRRHYCHVSLFFLHSQAKSYSFLKGSYVQSCCYLKLTSLETNQRTFNAQHFSLTKPHFLRKKVWGLHNTEYYLASRVAAKRY